MEKLKLKDIEFVIEKKCINFNEEFRCPNCKALLIPICINLGMVKDKFYCNHNFPDDCTKFGCPKYSYMNWKELQNYRLFGKVK
jgi:hypothetical protein